VAEAHRKQIVSTRSTWNGEWEERTGLFCDRFSEVCSPAIASAILSYNYGEVMAYGADAYEDREPLDILDHYVRVQIRNADDTDDERVWYGVIVGSTRELAGGHGEGKPAGRQILQAFGLEYLLTRKTVDTSIIARGSIGSGDPDKVIHRAIGFNLGGGGERNIDRKPNRGARGDEVFYAFAESLETAEEWTARDIVEYLLAYQGPDDRGGEQRIIWRLDTDSQVDDLSYYTPAMQVHGRTVKDSIDAIIDRRRAMSYKISVTDSDEVTLSVFTFNSEDIDLSDDRAITANPTIEDWDFSNDARILSAVINEDASPVFHEVVARGERRGACFTIQELTETLDADWEESLEEEYETGASGSDDYPDVSDSGNWPEAQSLNALVRRADKFERVYQYFRIPADWDGLVDGNPTVPVLDRLDEIGGPPQEDIWIPGLRLLPYLPFRVGEDYSDSAISDEDYSDTSPDYRRPFVLVTDGSFRFYYGDDLMGQLHEEGEQFKYNVSLQMQPDAAGVILRASTFPHDIASADFDAADAADQSQVDAFPEATDWRDFLLTVFMEADSFAEQRWPVQRTENGDVFKRLVIAVPNARIDWVCKGTVVEVADDGTLQTSEGGLIRDDRELLQDVARVAYQWYSRVRKAISLTRRSLSPQLEVGELLGKIGTGDTEEEINSVVTQIDYDFLQGTYSLKTEFAELDVRGLFR